MEEIRVFIGFDPREALAYHVCCQSILDNTKYPDNVAIHPVTGLQRNGTNAFTFARFLVPFRCRFQGCAIFIDGDMLVRADIAELWCLQESAYVGAQVVKRDDYKTKHPTKYLGQPNVDYPRKNWGSVVLWNCGFFPNRKLTPEFVQQQDPMYLRQFKWLDDQHIGDLPGEWNRLVGEEELTDGDKLRHFTIGAPCFQEYADCDGADEWFATFNRVMEPMKA